MALNIPPEDSKAIATMRAFASSSLDQFIKALRSAPPISSPQEMASRIAKQVPSVPLKNLESVVETLYTLYYIRDLAGVSPSTFLSDLMEGIPNNRIVGVAEKDIPKLHAILERLLNIDSLNIVAKAARLQRDGERLYCTGKVLSDIRPVFGDNPLNRPAGAVLTHTLKIGYHEGKEHQEFHVVLDSDDLNALAEVVKRAQTKDKTLRGLLKEARLPNLGD
jgi:hypothetical protein